MATLLRVYGALTQKLAVTSGWQAETVSNALILTFVSIAAALLWKSRQPVRLRCSGFPRCHGTEVLIFPLKPTGAARKSATSCQLFGAFSGEYDILWRESTAVSSRQPQARASLLRLPLLCLCYLVQRRRTMNNSGNVNSNDENPSMATASRFSCLAAK